MSWQSGLACWILRKWFYPRTRAPHFDVEHIRALASRRLWLPRVPSGWRLAEHYAADGGLLRGEWLEPATDAAGSPAGGTILYLHGGGYFFCSPRTHRALVFGLAKRTRARTFSLDYRLAPEHRFPAALDDALAAYRQLLSEGTAPESIVVAGDSAGGGLALALLVALRDAGERLPAGGLLFSPWTDLAATGESIRANDGVDPMMSGPAIGRAAGFYLGDTPATHPYASPLYASLQGLPPLFLLVGSTEVLLDDSRRVADKARAAGVSAELKIWPNMPDVWPILEPFLPESSQALDQAAAFVLKVTSGKRA